MNLQLNANITKSERDAKQFCPFFTAPVDLNRVKRLGENDKSEVLEFLKVRPVHTVVMTSYICDNGIESAENRGEFFGYRNARGKLEGVALIGHTTLIEARSEDSLKAFALTTQKSQFKINLMMSDGAIIERFWKYYAGDFRQPRLVCDELLFELAFPFFVRECQWNVRLAETSELEQIAEAHAEVAFIESGVNPLKKDRAGFLKRCQKRIENKRVFVVFENGKLVFKADIVAQTDDVVYLEGIYVAPEFRGKSVGSSCLAQLSEQLLAFVSSICLLSNSEFKTLIAAFKKPVIQTPDQ